MIRLVIFDLDDTLYNERDFVYSGFMEVATYLSNKYGISKNILFDDMVNILNSRGRGKIFDQICEKYHLKEKIEYLVELYRYNNPNISLYDDAYEVLDNFQSKYKLGLITDGYKGAQWNKIKALNIEKYMDKIIVTDDYGKDYWKPSVKPFQIMLDYFDMKAKETVYIGDNPNKDFIPCKKLGINSVRIIRSIGDYMGIVVDEKHEADYRIKSLLELEKILEEIQWRYYV